MLGHARSPMKSLERCLQEKVRPKERPDRRCTCRLYDLESCCLLQANRLGDLSQNVKIFCIHSSDDMYCNGSYSLIVIHQKWASAEGAGALFDYGMNSLFRCLPWVKTQIKHAQKDKETYLRESP